jgi:methionyl-tRNA formyltransferase
MGEAKLKILAVEPVALAIPIGNVVHDGARVLIGCGADAVILHQLQAPGKRPMATREYLRGNALPEQL